MNLPSIRYLTQAGGKLSEELVKEFKKICFKKKIKFFIMYGQTEATSRISILDWKNLKGNENSIGRAIFQGKLYIVNDKFKKIKSANVPGELVYEGKNVCMGYAKDRFDLAKEDQNKRILYTGDIAYKNKKNFFCIVGRKKRFVKIFSHRINLDDVEDVIKKYGFDCACTQSKDKILLFLKNDDNNSKNSIEKIIKNKMPFLRNFYKLKYIRTIPRSEGGKILYSKLDEK